ncbi:fibroblast growth factor receptor 4-like [Ptychodera flava]|uniref:fibroblast growth factor receptor 4-like n=1 Tax=Ptychodera flava TaxID=63121 RepID=UPI00396A0FE8
MNVAFALQIFTVATTLTLTVIIHEVTSSISWEVIPEDTLAREGQQTALFCKVNTDGSQHPAIKWTREGNSVDECCDVTGDVSNGESNLLIKNTTKSHDGEWQCQVAGLGMKNATVIVIGRDEPRCSMESGVDPRNRVIAGNTISLSCSVESILPSSAKLVWRRNNKPVKEDNSNPLLYTWQVEAEDHGASFTCKLKLRRSDTSFVCSENITLDVQYRPVIKLPSNICVKKATQLDCEYAPGNPSTTQVKWKTPNDETAMRDNPLIMDDIDLQVNNPDNYTCIVNNTFFDGSHGQDVAITSVQLQYNPVVSTLVEYDIKEGEDIELDCNVQSVPPATAIKWITPSGTVYQGRHLTLLNINRTHAGLYTCKATNKLCDDFGGLGNGSNSTFVRVKFKPTAAALSTLKSLRYEEFVTLRCCAECSNPAALIDWYINDIPVNISDGYVVDTISGNIEVEDVVETECENGGVVTSQRLSILTLPGNSPVNVKCSARNPVFKEEKFESDEETIIATFAPIYPKGCKTSIFILGKNDSTAGPYHVGTEITVRCISCSSYPTATIRWYLGEKYLRSPDQRQDISSGVFDGNVTEQNITIRVSSRDHGADLYCVAVNEIFPESPSLSERIAFQVLFPPLCVKRSRYRKVEVTKGERTILECEVSSNPKPGIQWFSSAKTEIRNNARYNVHLNSTGAVYFSYLTISDVEANDNGNYTCLAENEYGTVAIRVKLIVRGGIDGGFVLNHITIGVAAAGAFVIALATAIAVLIIRKEKRLQREAIKSKDDDYEEISATNEYVVNKTLDAEMITLSTTLTACEEFENGASDDDSDTSDKGYMDLVDERKSQSYLQPWVSILEFPRDRLHVVKTISTGKLYTTVKAFAWCIGGKDGQSEVIVKMEPNSVDAKFKDRASKELQLLKRISAHKNITQPIGCCTKNGPKYLIFECASGGNLKAFLRANGKDLAYATDIGQRRLLKLAVGIACGMKYLAEQQIVHRYLAAKHVLVYERGICKISNFSYASDVIEVDTFFEVNQGKLPYKWMAVESLVNKEFTSMTDVWSFGVVLWEIFSLGSSPYRKLSEADVLSMLNQGHRLPKPDHCRREIFAAMLACWKLSADTRPAFSVLHEKLQTLPVVVEGNTSAVVNINNT